MKEYLNDNPELTVNITHQDGTVEKISLEEDDRKMLRDKDTSIFDVESINIDLCKDSYQIEMYDNQIISKRRIPKIRNIEGKQIIDNEIIDIKALSEVIIKKSNIHLYSFSLKDGEDEEKLINISKKIKRNVDKNNRIEWVREIKDGDQNNIWIEGDSYIIDNVLYQVREEL